MYTRMPKVHVCWVKLQLESAIFYFKIKVSGCASSLAGWPAGNSTTSHQDELFQILSASAFKMERKKKESESQNFESEVPLSAFVWLIFQAVRPLFFFFFFFNFLFFPHPPSLFPLLPFLSVAQISHFFPFSEKTAAMYSFYCCGAIHA